ncbi:MAG: hypothetical protein JSR37_04295 [Verrucomicrobia bacterium]|nr:hypothetical protein [Verrucomicrobiota bacterium]MBS0636487.1 hypothetical protein [Verrucomicrobiota bacterium]
MTAINTELTSLLDQEPSLEQFSPVVNKKVEGCKEALYSAVVGAAWGFFSGLAVSALAYANGGTSHHIYVGTGASTAGAATGALVGTVAKNVLKRRVFRAIVGGCGTSLFVLSIYNAAMFGLGKSTPVWLQFAIGVPAATVGVVTGSCLREKMARLFAGFMASAGTGAAIGASIGLILPNSGPSLGQFGALAVCGYIIATDTFEK